MWIWMQETIYLISRGGNPSAILDFNKAEEDFSVSNKLVRIVDKL